MKKTYILEAFVLNASKNKKQTEEGLDLKWKTKRREVWEKPFPVAAPLTKIGGRIS